MLKNKSLLVAGLMVAVIAVVGAFKFAQSFSGDSSGLKYVIENFSGTIIESGDKEEGPLGAAEFNSGRTTHAQLDPVIEQRRTVVVTQSDLNDLDNDEDGITLIPSVGTDKVIAVSKIIGFRQYASESLDRGSGESFEVKWYDSGTASGGNSYLPLGASFSTGFLTGGSASTRASRNFEVWVPSALAPLGNIAQNSSSRSYEPVTFASSSAVILTGLVDTQNVETSGITQFIFEIFYRIIPRP